MRTKHKIECQKVHKQDDQAGTIPTSYRHPYIYLRCVISLQLLLQQTAMTLPLPSRFLMSPIAVAHSAIYDSCHNIGIMGRLVLSHAYC